MTKYYYAGGQRIAMYDGTAIYYPLTDHLGSTSVTLNLNGEKHSELRYMPYGENRVTSGNTPTQRRFTGQIEDNATGLYFYNARYYDPMLGRFIQPDSIVPEPGNPQSLNRYSYVYNNPLRYTDPTGHACYDETQNISCSTLASGMVRRITRAGNSTSMPETTRTRTRQEYLFTGLPIEDPQSWMNGFGPNTFAKNNWRSNYIWTSGLHNGIDIAASPGTNVYARTTGVIEAINTGDGNPNVAVRVDGYLIIYGHVHINPDLEVGAQVSPDTIIGTLQDQGDNTHLHLGVKTEYSGGGYRAHNPLNFFNPADVSGYDWGSYPEGTDEYTMNSFIQRKVTEKYNYWNSPKDEYWKIE